MKLTKLALACALTSALAACGGGGSSGTPTPTVTFGGTVIDGYIEGATVCLDLNVNQVCDSGEPSAVSKADGTYSMDITGLTAAQLKAAHLYTIVPDTAFDADDTVGGVKKTLKDAGKAPFNLMAPASAFVVDGKVVSSAVISPLTTLVSHDMITGNGKSLDDAQKAVRLRMGLDDETDLKQDFIAKNNTNLIQLAQVVAAAIGEVKKAAKDDNGADDRDALFAALGYLQQNVAALQTAVKEGVGEKMLDKVKTALLRAELKPTAEKLDEFIEHAKMLTDSSTFDIATILAEGFYEGDCLFDTNGCSPDYQKISGSNGTWQAANYELSDVGQWIKDAATSGDSGYRLTPNGWVARIDGESGTYVSDGQGGGTATETATGLRFRLTTRMVDLSGKTASQVAGMKSPPAALADKVFPDGSKLFWIQAAPLEDEYRLYTGYQLSMANPNCTVAPCEINLTTINEGISAYATDNASGNRLGFGSLTYTFDAGGSSTGGTVSIWSPAMAPCTTNGCATYTKTGSVPYEIKTVSGQQVLIIKTLIDDRGEYFMFAVKDGKLHPGSYAPAGNADSGEPSFNKVAMNAIMAAGNKPQVLD